MVSWTYRLLSTTRMQWPQKIVPNLRYLSISFRISATINQRVSWIYFLLSTPRMQRSQDCTWRITSFSPFVFLFHKSVRKLNLSLVINDKDAAIARSKLTRLLVSLLSYFYSSPSAGKLNLSLVINGKDVAIVRSKLTWLLASLLSYFCSYPSAGKLNLSLVVNDKDAAVARL